jgi:hypothetical protein
MKMHGHEYPVVIRQVKRETRNLPLSGLELWITEHAQLAREHRWVPRKQRHYARLALAGIVEYRQRLAAHRLLEQGADEAAYLQQF